MLVKISTENGCEQFAEMHLVSHKTWEPVVTINTVPTNGQIAQFHRDWGISLERWHDEGPGDIQDLFDNMMELGWVFQGSIVEDVEVDY